MNAYSQLWIEQPDNIVDRLMATGLFDAERAERIAEKLGGWAVPANRAEQLAVERSLTELLEEQD